VTPLLRAMVAMATSTILPIDKRTLASSSNHADASKPIDFLGDGTSTSAGSSSTASRASNDEWSPVNWRIRNTFLDMPFIKLTVMQGFQRNRRSCSCPAGGREAVEREELAAVSPCAVLDEGFEVAEAPQPEARRALTDAVTQISAPRPLALADLVGPQSHSKGSVVHFQGTCKPCAFFWKVVGCKYGSECEFCHLCDADERKRRNKEKRMAMHALQTSSRAHCAPPVRHSRGGKVLQGVV